MTSALDTRDRLLELADAYETVAALEADTKAPGGRAVAGSRLPPGMQDVLDDDEVQRALVAVDEWAEFCVHVLADERDVVSPGETPRRLRLMADNAAHFVEHEDEMLALSFDDDLHTHRRTMRRLARRGQRVILTGRRCEDCGGILVVPLGADDALVCDRDARHVVPYTVWSSWPRARVEYITAEHAARMLGLSNVAAVWQRAKRGQWRRKGEGRDVRYHVDDVRGVGVSA